MTRFLLVGLGSALGGMARYGCTLWLARAGGEAFPWGTLFVNVTGSFAIGFFFTLTGAGGRLAAVPPDWRLFATVGLCGGYTTFSSFSLQTVALLREGHALPAVLNIVGSVALCLGAVWLGGAGAAALNSRL